MRISEIMAGDEEGGLETHFVDLANGLVELGEDVTVIAHERYADRFVPTVRFRPLDLTRSRRDPFLRRSLRRLIKASKADVVHAHAGKAAALVAAVSSSIGSTRTVGTVHGRKRDLSAYRRFDAVIGVSRGVLEDLDHPAKSVVYNGVSAPPQALDRGDLRDAFGIEPDAAICLAVGRLVPVKRYDHLIGLWDRDLGHLLIAGEGPERGLLEALAKDKPVTLTGFRADVRAMMGAADLMVFASEREGLSYALAEALRAGLPVVSTPVPGAEDLLPGSHLAEPDELKAAIAGSLADPIAARDSLAHVFDWANRTLTVEHMVRATREVYRGETIHGHPPPSGQPADSASPRC